MICIPVSHSIILINGSSPWSCWRVNVNLYRSGFFFFFLYSLPLNIVKLPCAHTSISQAWSLHIQVHSNECLGQTISCNVFINKWGGICPQNKSFLHTIDKECVPWSIYQLQSKRHTEQCILFSPGSLFHCLLIHFFWITLQHFQLIGKYS